MAQDKATIIKQAQRFTAKGQIDKAIQEWEKVLEINPKDGNIHNTVGDLLLKKNDPEKAATFYFKAANLFRDQGFSMKAMALYKKILNINPQNTDALVTLAELNSERGLVGNANESYLAAAEILVKSDAVDKAVELYEKIMEISPDSLPLHQRIADLYTKIGLSVQAAGVYVRCAAAHLDRGNVDKAQALYQKVVDSVPGDPEGYIGLSKVLCSKEERAEAMKLLDRAAERVGGNEELLLARASLAFDVGRSDEALSSVEAVLSANPNSMGARRFLADLYIRTERYDDAWRQISRAVELCIDADLFDEAMEILGIAEQIAGKEEEILRLSVQVHRQDGHVERTIQSLKALAELLAERGDNEGARGALEEAAAMAPDDKTIATRLEEISGPAGDRLEIDISGIEPETTPEGKTSEESADDYVRSLEEQLTGSGAGGIDDFQSIDLGVSEEEEQEEEDSTTFEIPETELDVSVLKDDLTEELPSGPEDEDIVLSIDDSDLGASPLDTEPDLEVPRRDRYDEDLAEGDFYLEQGLKEEAIEIFQNMTRQYPDRPEPAERLAALLKPRPEEPVMKVRPAQKTDAKSFLDSLKDVESDAEGVHEKAKEEMDSIFDAFKKGVEHEVEEGDFDTHYNLGIAYKEMGLVDDAIREFQIAARVQGDSVQGGSMLAMCYMESGQLDKAVEEYRRLQELVGVDDERHLSVQYDLAVATEAMGDSKSALALFVEIENQAGNYKDVAERIQKLRG